MREGASSYIFIERYDDNAIAIKRRKRGQSSSLTAEYYMHRFVYMLLHNNPKYRLLFAPRPLGCKEKEYSMEAIEDGHLIYTENFSDDLKTELKEFYVDLAMHGFFPHDFELYLQVDGRVAIIDFEKFGEWVSSEEVVIDAVGATYFPEMLLSSPLLPKETPSWINDIKSAVKIYKSSKYLKE